MLNGVVVGAGLVMIVAAALWLRKRFLAKRYNRYLELHLSLLTSRARSVLPDVQLRALTEELAAILNVEQEMLVSGCDPLEARRISLEGAAQTIENHIYLNEIIPG
ncbi:MAG: hypothetical protein EON58_14950 [Alphaproteobacteria bacterium]|nr:MAG: hypothetical protein EON58_14950 [Alphaproteobacteria bacterium]